MDKTALVTLDFAIGLELIQALDRSKLSISVALWLYFSEYEDWRFALAGRDLDEVKHAKAYGLVHDAFANAGISLGRIPTLLILKMSDPLVRSLRRVFRTAKSVEGMRLGGMVIADRFVEDGVVYRIR